jgi:hypothetical protein
MKNVIKAITLSFCVFGFLSCNANNKEKEQLNLATVETIAKHEPKQYIKVALLLDTSNSMDGLIDQAKSQLWEIVNELSYAKCEDSKPNLQIALYEYGNDRLNSDEGYIRQVLAFSDDLDEISKQLFSLTTNGGNEYCGHVIQTAINQLNWGRNPDDLKLIFIAGNEPFTQGSINYKTAVKLAHDQDVTVNTIFCGDYNQGITSYWKEGADLAHGDYMAINHNHATVYIASPYDYQILQLNKKLNGTYIAYGYWAEEKIALQSSQDTNANRYGKSNAVSRTVSKSSHLYKNSNWDLVDAEIDKNFKYEDLKDSDLPQVLKGKTKAEIKAYVAKKRKEREAIQEEIQQLNLKRKDYISKQQKQTDNGLENAMIKAIKTQAHQKNYRW